MKAKEYKKILAAVLSASMLVAQPATVMASGSMEEAGAEAALNQEAAQPGEGEQQDVQLEEPEEVKQAKALDGSEEMVDISEKVLLMLEEGTVYLDEETGYLHDKETGQKVDPVTGERLDDKASQETSGNKPDSKPGDNTQGNQPGNPDEGTSQTPGENNGGKDEESNGGNSQTPGGENGSQNGNGQSGNNQGGGDQNGNNQGQGNVDAEGNQQGQGADGQAPADSDVTDNGSEVKKEEAQKEEQKEEEQKKEPAEEPDADRPSSNQKLIAGQQIVKIPAIEKDFRFWTVARRYAFAKADLTVREEMDKKARAVGTLKKNGLAYVLQEEKDGWLYIESGKVRGFVRAEEVLRGDDAQVLLKKYQEQAKKKAKREKKQYTGIERVVSLAKALVPQEENEAFFHTHSTVNQTVVDKKYALTTVGFLNVREGKGTNTRIVGTLKANSLCYILADEKEEWVYVESGDVRGFVNKRYLKTGSKTDKAVKKAGEDSFPVASEVIKPENNKACYYTLTSVKSGVPGQKVRASLIEFASQFIGNAYVWGGTSLTEGADCSGFVQSVFRQYGYELPRVAEDQAQFGTKIPLEDAEPGDLIFYAKDGYIHHVVIYAGDGKTVEAMGTEYGITQGKVDTSEAVWATRVLDDKSGAYECSSIGEVNATDDMYGQYLGDFQLTYYCSCEICCDVETGITATGTPVIEGQTIAVDPAVIPYGTQVIIGGHVFTAEDCGGAVKGSHIDIYVSDHERALNMGVTEADVYMVKK